MLLLKIGQNYEVVIPHEIVEKLVLKPGDWIEVKLIEQKIVLTPHYETADWSEEELRAVRRYLATEETQTAARLKAEESIEEVHR